MSKAPDTSLQTALEMAHVRPGTALEMMDRVIRIIQLRPRLFFWLTFLHALPLLVVCGLAFTTTSVTEIGTLATYIFFLEIPSFWPYAAMTAVAFQTILFPRREIGLWTALRATFDRVPYLILTMLIAMAGWALLGYALPAGLILNLTPEPLSIISIVLAIAMMVGGLYLYASWSLIPPVVMIEKKAFGEAIARSWQLMRVPFSNDWKGDSAYRRLVLIMLLPIAVFVTKTVASATVEKLFVGRIAIFELPSSLAAFRLELIIEFIATLIQTPYLSCALVMLYAEGRMRREALDIQVRLLTKGELGGLDDTQSPFGIQEGR